MNLTGSRATLIANVCALVAASVQTVEGAFIVHECFGYYRPQDTWAFFTPAFVMFIIRNRIFSYCFLALHIAFAVQMFFQTRSIHLVPDACGGRLDGPLGYMALFFVISVACLAIYAVGAGVRFAISAFASRK